MAGSNATVNNTVATPAVRKDGHKIAITRCTDDIESIYATVPLCFSITFFRFTFSALLVIDFMRQTIYISGQNSNFRIT